MSLASQHKKVSILVDLATHMLCSLSSATLPQENYYRMKMGFEFINILSIISFNG